MLIFLILLLFGLADLSVVLSAVAITAVLLLSEAHPEIIAVVFLAVGILVLIIYARDALARRRVHRAAQKDCKQIYDRPD
jgi:hypothetical protein